LVWIGNFVIIAVYAGIVCPFILSTIFRITTPFHGLFKRLVAKLGDVIKWSFSLVGRIFIPKPKDFCSCPPKT
jgi:hypothetical protein